MPNETLTNTDILSSDPRVMPARAWGYLAVTRDGEPLQIGASGATEDEALANYWGAVKQWRELAARPVS
jgi:hypothetical protein